MLRFHLDESFPGAVADGLLRRGIDVTITSEAGLLGASDEEQRAYALQESRVLLTRDSDFLRMNAQGVEHAGIVILKSSQWRHGEIIGALSLLAEDYEPDAMRGVVLYL